VPDRAAIVTGASRGIGLALAETLGEEGFGLTITARKPDTLERTAGELRERGFEVEHVAANLNDEEAIREVVRRHRERYGRLDVLVNNAGIGVGAPATEHQTKYVDLQLDVNLRAIVLFYRECGEMLRAAGAEHRNALVVNMASIAGKSPQAWLSVYSATKAAVAAYSVSMNKELAKHGVKSVAFAPGFVDTDMTDYVKDKVPADQMLRPSDLS
jgi:NAD(P)-dependent dehydrogenase (short-subunit alcohol dehydrogenase family)